MQAPQTMVYKAPGEHALHGGMFDYLIVDDTDLDEALAGGWHLTTGEAQAAHEKLKADAAASAPPPAPAALGAGQVEELGGGDDAVVAPTRAELEQKGKELGLEWHPLLGDKKLQVLIDEKLKADAGGAPKD